MAVNVVRDGLLVVESFSQREVVVEEELLIEKLKTKVE